MKNNEKNEILSFQDMQDLLCDYVFEKLNDEKRQAFENSLFKYPDLINEIDEIKQAFANFQQKNLDRKISAYTRNLSVKVNQKLSEQRRLTYKLQWLYKYLIPVSGIAVIFLIVSYFNLFENDQTLNPNSLMKKNVAFTGITQSDIDSLFNNDNDTINYLTEIGKLIPAATQSQSDLLAKLDENNLGVTLKEVYDDILSELILQEGINISKFGNIKQYDLFKNFENLEEEDIENILKELENADFNT
ncbi:MAG: hypothetical protein V1779_02330 [bacterium]